MTCWVTVAGASKNAGAVSVADIAGCAARKAAISSWVSRSCWWSWDVAALTAALIAACIAWSMLAAIVCSALHRARISTLIGMLGCFCQTNT
jgi:hypothetical protein